MYLRVSATLMEGATCAALCLCLMLLTCGPWLPPADCVAIVVACSTVLLQAAPLLSGLTLGTSQSAGPAAAAPAPAPAAHASPASCLASAQLHLSGCLKSPAGSHCNNRAAAKAQPCEEFTVQRFAAVTTSLSCATGTTSNLYMNTALQHAANTSTQSTAPACRVVYKCWVKVPDSWGTCTSFTDHAQHVHAGRTATACCMLLQLFLHWSRALPLAGLAAHLNVLYVRLPTNCSRSGVIP